MPKPFDLKLALEGKPVITRDGKEVTQLILFNDTDANYPLLAVIDNKIKSFTKDGLSNLSYSTCNDLFMAPDKVTKWVNIYKNCANKLICNNDLYDSEYISIQKRSANCIATVPITFEI